MSVYFSSNVILRSLNHPFSKDFPTCDYYEVNQGWHSYTLRTDETKRLQHAKDIGCQVRIVHSGIHYFNEIGYPVCKICGWCPILTNYQECKEK